MSLRALEDKLIVRPLEDPALSKGGLWVPEHAKQRIDQGIVIYRGPATTEVRVGDHVLFSGYTGTKITVEDEGVFFVLKEGDVMALLIDEETPILFPLSEAERLIEEVYGRAVSEETVGMLARRVGLDPSVTGRPTLAAIRSAMEYLKESTLAKFREYVREEGFEF